MTAQASSITPPQGYLRAPRSWSAILTLYLAAIAQGLTLVSFPASSAVLTQMHGFSDAQYGAIFLPQVAAAVLGALAGGNLAARIGLAALLRIALAVNALSQLLLLGTADLSPQLAFIVVMLGTASLGAGFGLSGASLNGLPTQYFPRHAATAIVAMHTCLGLGLAVGPIAANLYIAAGRWNAFPLSLALLALVLVCAPLRAATAPLALDPDTNTPATRLATPPTHTLAFWLYLAIAVLYAFAEGTFSNWTVLYLQDVKRLPQSVASSALSAFWAAMVTGRLLASVLVLRIAAPRIWLTLPLLMIAAFLLLPLADTPALGIGLFVLAGLACSAFFPLSIGIASARFSRQAPWVSSMLIAALMVGVGLGSYAVGLLRHLYAMETLYRLSIVYPLLVLALAAWALRGAATPPPPVD
jgi:predicted MFS family arabinose efflux permease